MRACHLLLVAAAAALAGCTTARDCPEAPPRARYLAAHPEGVNGSEVMGVASFAFGKEEVSNTFCWASRGDKYAQFAVGYAFEHAEGPNRQNSLRVARHFYRLAARSESGQRSFYAAPVGNQSYGSVISVPIGAARAGLPEAAEALRRLELQELEGPSD